MIAQDHPVDAVITWVDGNDRAHAEKLARHFSSLNMERPNEAASCRFNQCGEIDYCVASLLRFAPWVRTIFIVTDGQTPPIVKQLEQTLFASKIRLVDHSEIFQGLENCMPTFNSLAIESVLWRIKDLTDNFIYLNDDLFLIRPVSHEHFFQNKGLVLRGSWKTHFEYSWIKRLKKQLIAALPLGAKPLSASTHRALQERTAKLAGFEKKFFHLPHAPIALKKSTLESFFQKNPGLLSENAAYSFRHANQFWPMSLAQHLEIKNNQAIFDNSLKAAYIDVDLHSLGKIQNRLRQADKNAKVAFVCIQGIDSVDDYTKSFMLNWLNERIQLECLI